MLDLSRGNCQDHAPLWNGVFMTALGGTLGLPGNHDNPCGGSGSSDVTYQVTPWFDGAPRPSRPRS